MAIIGIDAGGTKIAALVFQDGQALERLRIPTDTTSTESVVEGIKRIFSRLLEKMSPRGIDVKALGVGIAGHIDYDNGVVTFSPNLPLHDTRLRDILEENFGLPVFVDNDANVAALAEARMGVGKGSRHLVHLTLGTGIGGGIIMDGKIYHGALGAAAELGHIIILENGPLCNCGAHGCLESLASGIAIYRRVGELAESGVRSPAIEAFLADSDAFDAEALCRHADNGDEIAREILQDAGRHLGTGIASLVNIFNPDVVTLSGGLLGCYHHMEADMRASFAESAIPISRSHVRILTGTLGEDGGILGAAILASEGSGGS